MYLVNAACNKWPDIFNDNIQDLNPNVSPRQGLFDLAWDACSKCEECVLSKTRYNKAVWGSGSINSEVIAIGEGPGQYEERTLIPFTSLVELNNSRCSTCNGFSSCFPKDVTDNGLKLPVVDCTYVPGTGGKANRINTVAHYLNEVLDTSYPREKVYLTNVVKCRSRKGAEDMPPSTEQCKRCSKWLEVQMEIIQPSVVLVIGSVAGKLLCGNDFRITKRSGVFTKDIPNSTLIPRSVERIGYIYHPSAISRQQELSFRKSMLESSISVIKGMGKFLERR